MEALEPIGQVVEQRALDLDLTWEGVVEARGVIARVGVRALGEEDVDERAGALPLGGCREGCRRDLVRGEARLRRAAQHLGDDPGEGFRAATLRWTVRDVCPGSVATRDVTGIGQPSVDRADRVGVHSERSAELPDRGEASTGQEPTGVDLVGELPEDLGRNRDVRVALDVEVAGPGGDWRIRHGMVVSFH